MYDAHDAHRLKASLKRKNCTEIIIILKQDCTGLPLISKSLSSESSALTTIQLR